MGLIPSFRMAMIPYGLEEVMFNCLMLIGGKGGSAWAVG